MISVKKKILLTRLGTKIQEEKKRLQLRLRLRKKSFHNKAGNTAIPVVCGWAGAVQEKVTKAFGQEQKAQKAQKRK